MFKVLKNLLINKKKFNEELTIAHKFSNNNVESLKKSDQCGCFYCLRIFPATEVKEFAAKKTTIVCPYCGIDSVITDFDFKFDPQFLKEMKKYWFDRTAKINN